MHFSLPPYLLHRVVPKTDVNKGITLYARNITLRGFSCLAFLETPIKVAGVW